VEQGDTLLLCSDGFWSPLTDQELLRLTAAASLRDTLSELVEVAVFREAAHADNTTAVVARLGDAEQDHPTDTTVCMTLGEH
jgi:serine/threonine protein phosphatase PrpC